MFYAPETNEKKMYQKNQKAIAGAEGAGIGIRVRSVQGCKGCGLGRFP